MATPRRPAVDMRYVTRYSTGMSWSIRHKGLKRLHEDDDWRGVIREHAEKLRDILARLDAADTIADMDVPGFRLHPLKGEHKGFCVSTGRKGSHFRRFRGSQFEQNGPLGNTSTLAPQLAQPPSTELLLLGTRSRSGQAATLRRTQHEQQR